MTYIETSFQSCLPFCISPSGIQRFQFFHIFFGHFVLHETVDVAIILKINYPTYVTPLSLACKQHWTMIHLFAFYFSMVFFLIAYSEARLTKYQGYEYENAPLSGGGAGSSQQPICEWQVQ